MKNWIGHILCTYTVHVLETNYEFENLLLCTYGLGNSLKHSCCVILILMIFVTLYLCIHVQQLQFLLIPSDNNQNLLAKISRC